MGRGPSRRRLASLRRTRATLASTGALLALARALGELTTSPEAAQRIAEAVPAVTGCDQSTVLLPDSGGRFVVRGVAGPADERARLAERTAIVTDHLGLAITQLPPAVVTCIDDAPDAARSAMAALGIAAMGVAAVRVGDEVRALLTAEWYDAGDVPPIDELERRLRSVADQAAHAVDNARLLDAVRHQALHDALTGLPNKVLFDDRVVHAVTRARRSAERVAIGVLDLDRFKTINDSLGHRAGDLLLVEVADRLRAAMRAQDTVARMGGDEFTLLLPDLQPHGEAIVAERLLAAFEAPFVIDGHPIRISPSIGLASFPDDGDTPDRLLRGADAAMYRAKENGRNTWATYASGMSERAYDRLTLEADLHRALERRELRVGFQPIMRISDGSRQGVEALVRWSHPSFGMLAPGEFLPLADEIGLAPELDAWVLRQACLELGRADVSGASSGSEWISVNVAARTLAHPSLLGVVHEGLALGGLAPERLVLEVAESITSPRREGVVEALRDLRAVGVRIALDNFGRTNAPLAELAALPLDLLKVDRSFFSTVRRGDEDAPVLAAVVTMAHDLGLLVVAEGVATPEQLALATRHGVDLAQGHVLGRAEPTLYAAEGASAPIA